MTAPLDRHAPRPAVRRAACRPGRRAAAAVAAATLLSAGCASLPDGAQRNAADPLERVNRGVFAFNDALDEAVARPVARTYRAVVPELFRASFSNVFSNLGDVLTSANQLLQGKPLLALSDAGRVVINTIFGFGGLADVASDLGLEKHREDFGQTLGRWGAPPGPYIVLPVFGPSSVRDGVGYLVDLNTDPLLALNDLYWRRGLFGLRLVNTREQLLDAEKVLQGIALDRYSFIRDAYLSRRRSQVYDGDPPPLPEEDVDAGTGDASSNPGPAAVPTPPAPASPVAPAPAGQPPAPAAR